MNNSNRNIYLFLPIIIALVLIAGVYLGKQMSPQPFGSTIFFAEQRSFSLSDKLDQVIQYIENDYVDTIQEEQLIENTINELLQKLDPHSYYIPKSQYAVVNDPLEGNFEGIGIEFRIQKDSVVVVQPIGGGPSEKVGIMSGDRIVAVEEENITGEIVDNNLVVKLLKGPKGSKVNMKIKRPGVSELLQFTVIRDEIPLHSVEASYMVGDVGYIKIIRFSKTTYDEFVQAVDKLKSKGIKGLVLDLRNNGGGYLLSATKIADEFLEDGKLIVYTEGKSREKEEFFATSKGKLEDIRIAVLINEGSASASEILAGAIQDHDRGIIIGRRSFGKGLVQEGIQWPDGSAMRLTVARYYTPTGRSIQKPFSEGLEAYNQEAYERYENGELFSSDSIHFVDSLKYITPGGDTVYGGGGIMPDIFIPIDTVGSTPYFGKLNFTGMFYQFGFNYVDINRDALKAKFNAKSFVQNFKIDQAILKEFYDFADTKGLTFDKLEAKASEEMIKNRLKATIGRNLWGNNVFYKIVNESDMTFTKALEELAKTKKPS